MASEKDILNSIKINMSSL